MRQAHAERPVRHLSDGLEEGKGDLSADNGGGLQQPFLLRWQSIDPRRQDRLHRGWKLELCQGFGESGRPTGSFYSLVHEDSLVKQRPYALF
jgi:hypothetical protein